MQPLNFEEVLQRISSQDSRYHREAYLFLREALDYTQKRLSQGKRVEPRHVTGQELLSGIREYALTQFGPMAKTVLNEWGVKACEDFGEMVFKMVEHGLLSQTEKDSRDDFKGGFDFDQAFCQPFRPRVREDVPGPQGSQP
jgi:uncharacterized repeat protein (TIGR04138 family)